MDSGACQAPLSMGFSRQEYWSDYFLFPISGHLPDPGDEPASPVSPALAGRFFTSAPPGKTRPIEFEIIFNSMALGQIGKNH